jgi:hypothetical protein
MWIISQVSYSITHFTPTKRLQEHFHFTNLFYIRVASIPGRNLVQLLSSVLTAYREWLCERATGQKNPIVFLNHHQDTYHQRTHQSYSTHVSWKTCRCINYECHFSDSWIRPQDTFLGSTKWNLFSRSQIPRFPRYDTITCCTLYCYAILECHWRYHRCSAMSFHRINAL